MNYVKGPKTDGVLQKIAQLYLAELEYLAEKTTVDVFVCAFPFILVQFLERDDKVRSNADDTDDLGGEQEPVAILAKIHSP